LALTLGAIPGGFHRTAQVVWLFLLPVLLAEFLLAYTATGRALLTAALGIPPNLVDQSIAGFRVLMFMAPATALRFVFQGYLVRYRHTKEISAGIVLRIVYTVVGGLAMVKWLNLPGVVIGGFLLVGGVCAEALVNGFGALRLRGSALPVDDLPLPSVRSGVGLFFPLAGAALLASAARPVINLGLAQAPNPDLALAAYAASFVVAVPIWIPLQNMHQVSLVFAGDQSGRRRSQRFGLMAGAAASALLAVVAFTPVGEWLLVREMHLSPALAAMVRPAVGVQALLPLVLAWSDFYLGLLLKAGRTRAVGLARVLNVLAVVAVTLLTVPLVRSAGEAAALGSAAFALGYAVEGVVNMVAFRMPPVDRR